MSIITNEEIAFGRFADLQRIYGIPRSTAYVLINQGLIKSRYVRPKGGGIRLIDFNSVRAFLARAPERPSAKVSRDMTKRAFASADARAAKNAD